MIIDKKEPEICCICGKKFRGYGNNPYPAVKDEEGAVCCDSCNRKVVIPARLKLSRRTFH